MSLPDGVSPRKHYSVDEKDDLAEFFTFAREGDFAGMAELLERDDFVVKQENLYRAMRIAASRGYLDIFRYLTEKKHLDPNRFGQKGQIKPIHIASRMGKLSIVRYLVEERGVSPNEKSLKNGWLPLHYAAMEGETKVVSYFLKNLRTKYYQEDDNGYSPICLAASGDHLEVVIRFMEERKVSLDKIYKGGDKLVHIAAEDGALRVMEYFIGKKYFDKNEKTSRGHTPIHKSVFGRHLDLVKYLTEQQEVSPDEVCKISGKSSVDYAAVVGDPEIFEYLVDKRHADYAREGTVKKYQPIHWAVRCSSTPGHLGIIKFLIELKGVGPNEVCNQYVPKPKLIHMAVSARRRNVITYLVQECGVDINSVDSQDNTPLAYSITKEDQKMALFLVRNGVNVTEREVRLAQRIVPQKKIFHYCLQEAAYCKKFDNLGHARRLKRLQRSRDENGLTSSLTKSSIEFVFCIATNELIDMINNLEDNLNLFFERERYGALVYLLYEQGVAIDSLLGKRFLTESLWFLDERPEFSLSARNYHYRRQRTRRRRHSKCLARRVLKAISAKTSSVKTNFKDYLCCWLDKVKPYFIGGTKACRKLADYFFERRSMEEKINFCSVAMENYPHKKIAIRTIGRNPLLIKKALLAHS